jgi:hypothetical protein
MTFGSSSAIFQQAMLNPMLGRLWTTAAPTSFSSLSADTIDVALFNDTTTPSKSAALTSTLYNTGVWVTANEVIDTGGSNWAAGGRALASKAFSIDTGSSSVCFQAAALAGAGNVTIASAFGCLVYDATTTGTPVKQGLCYNSFGGSAQGVTAGTFTIVWATVGALTSVVVFNVTV